MKLADLALQFPVQELLHTPPGCYNKPITGWIPMDFYRANEEAIREARKEYGYTRVYYRGPRRFYGSSTTLKEDAKFAVIYTDKW